MTNGKRLLKGMTLCACIATATAGQVALAQTAAADESSSGTLDEVVVTGSRIKQVSGFTTPTPVTMIDSAQLQNLGIVNLGDAVATMPSNRATTSPTTAGMTGNFNIGAQLANLRGLNPFFGTRTLTLVDGRRFVPSTNGGAVDLNLIPSNLVQRTEVVTGGASAAYGSDAVAGVVNIILDTKLQGVRAQIDYGATGHGDGGDSHAALSGGTSLFDGAGHIIGGVEYQNSKGIYDCTHSRDWCNEAYGRIENTDYSLPNGQPRYIIGPNAKPANMSLTGVLLAPAPVPGIPGPLGMPGPVIGQFNDAGTAVVPYATGQYANTQQQPGVGGQLGGDGPSVSQDVSLRAPVERYSLFSHFDYDFTSTLQGFAELSYGHLDSANREPSRGTDVLNFGAYIAPDNAFLPPAIAAAYPGGFNFSRSTSNTVLQENNTTSHTSRAVLGLKGQLSDTWTWDSYFTYGKTSQSQNVNHMSVPTLLGWALDAVRDSSGNIVCRTTLPGPAFDPRAAGCVPINLFGVGNASQAAIDYTWRTQHEDFDYDQYVLAGNVSGQLVEGWAGPISMAAGVELRKESGTVEHPGRDSFYYALFANSYGDDFAGDLKAGEGYLEVDVPLAKDLPGAKTAGLNFAVRKTYYENEGGRTSPTPESTSSSNDITTWKIGGTWEPLDWLRLRATRSRDIRAAGFRELYYYSAFPFFPVNNPWTGQTDFIAMNFGGNVGLKPEKADTTTAGFILQPGGWAEGIRFSADYYEVILKDAINSLVFPTTYVNECYNNGKLCDNITFTNGIGSTISYVDSQALNMESYTTRGVDAELAYAMPLSRLSDSWNGNLSFRLIGSYLKDMIENVTGTPVNIAGQLGGGAFSNFVSAPKWMANAVVSYQQGPLGITLAERYIGRGKYDITTPLVGPDSAAYDPSSSNSINDNTTSSAFYTTLSASYDLKVSTGTMQIFGVVNNLFDQDPRIAPTGGAGAAASLPTNPTYYDTLGMSYRLGFRLNF